MSAKTSLYWYYDAAGQLLYVGVTGRGATRGYEHNRDKAWWPLVATSRVEHFDTRDEALNAEAYAIEFYRPPHNTAGKPTGAPRLVAIPKAALRTVMGRLSWQRDLTQIDPDYLAQDLPHCRHAVLVTFKESLDLAESVDQFKSRLKAVAARR